MEYLNLNIYDQVNMRVSKDEVNEAYRRLSMGESIISRRVFTKSIKRGTEVK